ncbi:MAG TPA: permease-like cell division protein FtsX [Bacteroidota bacterium]|nr:permease-like cell division protein FtsX [Bacteroidota bacterium]
MSTFYIVKEGLSGFRRAKLAAVGSIITIAIALLLVGVFYVISSNTSRIVEGIRERVEMEAFLQQPVGEQRVAEIQKALMNVRGVDHVTFVSKEEAARIFKEEFGEEIKDVLDFNPLPPSFKVFLQEPYRTTAKADEVSTAIKNISGVDEVVYRKGMLEFIEKQAGILYYIGLGIGILISISAIFLVSNTIRLAIYAKRKSIQTMKLVGASRWFVRAPFLVEGLFQGILGGGISAALLYYMIGAATQFVSDDLALFLRADMLMYAFMVAAGIVLGLFGSAVSVRRFIGEKVAS